MIPQTGFEKESNDVVPSLAGLREDRFPEPAGPAGPDAAPGTPQVVRGTTKGDDKGTTKGTQPMPLHFFG